MEKTTQDTDTSTDPSKPDMTDQGFVAQSELPSCPEGCEDSRPVIGHKPNSGLEALYCKQCGRILTYLEPADMAVSEEDSHYAAVGDKAWGAGTTKDEAVENLKENLDEDSFPVYDLWVSNRELQVSRYGSVIGEEGSQVILHHLGKKRLHDR